MFGNKFGKKWDIVEYFGGWGDSNLVEEFYLCFDNLVFFLSVEIIWWVVRDDYYFWKDFLFKVC